MKPGNPVVSLLLSPEQAIYCRGPHSVWFWDLVNLYEDAGGRMYGKTYTQHPYFIVNYAIKTVLYESKK